MPEETNVETTPEVTAPVEAPEEAPAEAPVEEGKPVGPATIVTDEPMIEQFPTHEETI